MFLYPLKGTSLTWNFSTNSKFLILHRHLVKKWILLSSFDRFFDMGIDTKLLKDATSKQKVKQKANKVIKVKRRISLLRT